MMRYIIRSVIRSVEGAAEVIADAFSPSDLFASGEQGAWYDPSDLTTLFQVDTGATPVTADGDPAGLMLDKSQGLELGAALVTGTNADFSSGVGDWVAASADDQITASGGVAKLEILNNFEGFAELTVGDSITKSKWHLLEIDIVNATNTGQIQYLQTGAFYNPVSSFPAGSSTARLYFLAPATASSGSQDLVVRINGGAGQYVEFTNVRLSTIAGNHATQSVSASRPVYNEPTTAIEFDAVDDKHTTTFPDLGTNVTIAYADPGVGAVIQTGQTIGAGDYDWDTNHAGLIIVDRVLTTLEISQVTDYLNDKAGV